MVIPIVFFMISSNLGYLLLFLVVIHIRRLFITGFWLLYISVYNEIVSFSSYYHQYTPPWFPSNITWFYLFICDVCVSKSLSGPFCFLNLHFIMDFHLGYNLDMLMIGLVIFVTYLDMLVIWLVRVHQVHQDIHTLKQQFISVCGK